MARDLAQKLGYAVFEKEIIPLFMKRLDRKVRPGGECEEPINLFSAHVIDFASSRLAFLKKDILDPQEYKQALNDVFWELARMGKVIIVGRGAQFILQNYPEAFHIRLVADLEDRLEHLKQEHLLKLTDISLIHKIQTADRHRLEFLRTHFNRTAEDPLLYHLTINLSKTSRLKAQEIILQLIS
jgi:hypothetical protein